MGIGFAYNDRFNELADAAVTVISTCRNGGFYPVDILNGRFDRIRRKVAGKKTPVGVVHYGSVLQLLHLLGDLFLFLLF